ncbi:K(+)-transporting ATPase subunit C [Aquihabitans sp. G128]|uniref:K(+)-transporting ATPase subunit C n=1 Tax=Aquihabitans sp. G128 TaxID=2849779 RepID=UPI001C24E7AA|nr:K(+)-transporting ATPase subunit C [Aquihabitans sp. G128]QXC59793.1 K(+)-transporting ATPase subunit C [Aquihabitans sp. G128]
MRTFTRQLLPALRMLLVLTVLCGVAYPLALTGLAQLGFGAKADGSLVRVDGRVVGSSLLGQEFTGAEWFHSRPSSAGAGASGSMVPVLDADGKAVLDADGQPKVEPADVADVANDASGSSNLGPTNPDLIAAVEERATAYRAENDLPKGTAVPVDAVTGSGSGVDPQISVANARLQAPRVARERGLPVAEVLALVRAHTQGRTLGFLGEPGVNVLTLNLSVAEAAS